MKRIISLILMLAVAFTLCACGMGSSPAATPSSAPSAQPSAPAEETAEPAEAAEAAEAADPYANVEHKIIRFSSTDTTANFNDPGYSNAASDIYMRDLIYERTEGRYMMQIFPDGQLASADTEALAGLKSGNFEITTLANGAFGAFSDAYAELSVPFFYPNKEVARAVLDGEVGAAMKAKAEADLGVKVMLVKDMGFRVVTTSGKQIKNVPDFKGIKIRTQQDPVQMAAFEALGCSVQSIPFSELYTSLQQKVIDAQENPWTNIYYKQFYEVQSYAIETNHIETALIYIMNQKFWDSLSAEDQEIFEGIFRDVEKYQRQVMEEGETFYKQACVDAGMTIYTPTEEEAAAIKEVMVGAVYNKCEETMGTERWTKLNDFVNGLT